jgi:serine/threonine protein kinase
MYTEDGTTKLVDFGIAKVHRDDTFMTQDGQIMGTPRYMSPEQAKGLNIDHRSDIYSLGATFYHLLTGIPPFDADNAVTLVMKHIEEPVRSIDQINDHVPEKLCNIIYGCMAKNPSERFVDYNQLIIALENVYRDNDEGIQTYQVVEPESEQPLSSGSLFPDKRILTGAGVLVLLVIGLFFATSGNGNNEDYDPNDAGSGGASLYEDEAVQDASMSQTARTLRDIHSFRQELDEEAGL